MDVPAATWISQLNLKRHVEGGWYGEVYRSADTIGERSLCTHIYFLLEQGDFSDLHRIRSDELWHFYAGDNLIVYEFDQLGLLTGHKLGNDPTSGFLPFCVIKKGNWFGARLAGGGSYALVGCTVSPGFDFDDFELADAN